jgi:hypothetical protein
MNLKDKPTYEIKVYAPDMICLIRTEKMEKPIKGLPPTYSYSIVMNPNEIDDLMRVLNDYADKRRNT